VIDEQLILVFELVRRASCIEYTLCPENLIYKFPIPNKVNKPRKKTSLSSSFIVPLEAFEKPFIPNIDQLLFILDLL